MLRGARKRRGRREARARRLLASGHGERLSRTVTKRFARFGPDESAARQPLAARRPIQRGDPLEGSGSKQPVSCVKRQSRATTLPT